MTPQEIQADLKRLQSNPSDILRSYNSSTPLFAKMGATSEDRELPLCGTIVQIRGGTDSETMDFEVYINGYSYSNFKSLIKEDERIPKREEEIRLEDLPVFAEWQMGFLKYKNGKNNDH